MLNKILMSRIFLFFVFFILPFFVMAQEGGLAKTFSCENPPCGLGDVLPAIERIIQFIAVDLVVPLAIIAFAYAGFIMITSAGNPGGVARAKDIMWITLKGLVYVFGAYIIVRLIVYGLSSQEIGVFESQLKE